MGRAKTFKIKTVWTVRVVPPPSKKIRLDKNELKFPFQRLSGKTDIEAQINADKHGGRVWESENRRPVVDIDPQLVLILLHALLVVLDVWCYLAR